MTPAPPNTAVQPVEFHTKRRNPKPRPFLLTPSTTDLVNQPPDPRLVAKFGAANCLHHHVLPWKHAGSVTVVLVEDQRPDARLRDHLRSVFGAVRFARCPRRVIDAEILRIAGPELAHAAETSVPLSASCRTWDTRRTRRLFGVAAIILLTMAVATPAVLLIALIGWATVALILNTGLKVAAALADIAGKPSDTTNNPGPILARLPVVSILVPLYREKEVAAHIMRRLSAVDYPRDKLDVCLIVEDDDAQTRQTLEQTDLPNWAQVIEVPLGTIRTKPRALNHAMTVAKGSIVGIYDAEDAPEEQQLRKVVQTFANRPAEVACLQGKLDYYNPRSNWIARCFTLEYATWFRLILPGMQRLGLVLPLGGTTLFLRRGAIEDVGGWDAHNVTEDADLGIRLARAGYRTEIIDTVTFEEANARPWPWVRQRSRWLKGYAMTWAVHMRQPRELLRELGLWRFIGVQMLFLGTLSSFLLAPFLWSFWLILFGLPHPLDGTVSTGLLHAMGCLFICSELLSLLVTSWAARRAGRPLLALWSPMMQIYFPMATLAVYKGLAEMINRPFFWDKTEHGLHDMASTPPPRPSRHPVAAE